MCDAIAFIGFSLPFSVCLFGLQGFVWIARVEFFYSLLSLVFRCQPADQGSVLLKEFAVVVLNCVLGILMLVFDKYCSWNS